MKSKFDADRMRVHDLKAEIGAILAALDYLESQVQSESKEKALKLIEMMKEKKTKIVSLLDQIK